MSTSGIAGSTFVDESLEEQVVPDRVDSSDAEHVGHDRIGRAAPTLCRDSALAGEPHDVPADQEELGQAGLLDDVQLVGQLPDDGRRDGVIAAAGAFVAQFLEVRKRRVALRNGEAGEAIALETEVDRAAGGQLAGITDSFSPSSRCTVARILSDRARRGRSQKLAGRRRPGPRTPRQRVAATRRGFRSQPHRHQFLARFQVRLAVRTPKVAQLAEWPAVANRGQDVLHLATLGIGVVDVVRDDRRKPEF